MRMLAIALTALALTGHGALAQDIEAGANSFKKCQICHDVGPGAKSKMGPELNGLDGRKAGTVDNFGFSEGMRDSGITWNEQTFREFMKDPRGKIPNTKMFYPGVKDDKEIGDMWAYLKQFKKDGSK
jgi:cytochrome c